MSTLAILLLALVQGITEFLPVSSSGHLILANRLFAEADEGVVFDVAVHLGSLLAVIWYFRADLLAMLAGRGDTHFGSVPPRRLLLWLVAATVPLGLVGLLAADHINAHLRNPTVIAWASIGFGVLLLAADRWGRREAGVPLTVGRALAVGVAQVAALIPGASRSGVTMTAGLALGMDRQGAARFSFLLAIPAIGAAGVWGLAEMLSAPPLAWIDFALAVAASAVGAGLCIGAFLRLVDRIGFLPFVIYRVLLGIALLTI